MPIPPVPPNGTIHLPEHKTNPSDPPPRAPMDTKVPGPNYRIPTPPPDAALGTAKPLMILRIKPGIEINETQRASLMTTSEQISKALNSGGGLILDESVIEPVVLIYGGQVIRFDGYEEDLPEITRGYKSEPTRPTRQTEQERETW